MSTSFKRQLAVAAATIGVVTTLGHAALPDHARLAPPAEQRELQRQYNEARKRELEARRVAGNDLGEAVHRDKLRPAKVRPAEKIADDIARKLMRRLP